MLQAIADSMGDTTQTEDVTFYGFSILPKLNRGPNSSPLDGVILKVLRAKWDLNIYKYRNIYIWSRLNAQYHVAAQRTSRIKCVTSSAYVM